jgi:hypothetical protein
VPFLGLLGVASGGEIPAGADEPLLLPLNFLFATAFLTLGVIKIAGGGTKPLLEITTLFEQGILLCFERLGFSYVTSFCRVGAKVSLQALQEFQAGEAAQGLGQGRLIAGRFRELLYLFTIEENSCDTPTGTKSRRKSSAWARVKLIERLPVT